MAKPTRPSPRALPITAEDLADPQKFAQWQFAHAPVILQYLLDELPHAGANERVRVLADLYGKCLDFRPYIPINNPTNAGNDAAAALAALLAASPVPEEEPHES